MPFEEVKNFKQIYEIGKSQNQRDSLFFLRNKQTLEDLATKRLKFKQKENSEMKNYIEKIKALYFIQAPNILKPDSYAIEQEEGQYMLYIIMKKMNSNLEQIIQQKAKYQDYFSTAEMKAIIKPIFLSLQGLEKNNFPHQNLKPSNILRQTADSLGSYKLVDVGVNTKVQGSRLLWDPPEFTELKDNRASKVQNFALADAYSFGMIIVQAATLKEEKDLMCFKDDNTNDYEDILKEIKQRYGKDLFKLINSLTEYDINSRKPVSQLMDQLEDFLETEKEFEGGGKGISGEAENQEEEQAGDDDFIEQFCSGFKNKVQSQKLTAEEFLSKYDYSKQTKIIEQSNFVKALKDLDLNYKTVQLQIILQKFKDKSSDNLKLNFLIDYFNQGNKGEQAYEHVFDKRLPKLVPEEEQQLKDLLKQIGEFVRNNNVNLKKSFQNVDLEENNFLPINEFQDIMQKNQLPLKKQDIDLIQQKFDLDRKDQIHYLQFLEAINNLYNVSNTEILHVLQQLYKAIRTNCNTIEQFFKENGGQDKRYLTTADVHHFMQKEKINVPEKVLTELFKKLDQDGKNQIIQIYLERTFQEYIDSDKKDIIGKIYQRLYIKKLKFIDIMNDATMGKMISLAKLQSALDKINADISQEDLYFMVSVYRLKPTVSNKEIDHTELRKRILETIVDMNLPFSREFEDPKDPIKQKNVTSSQRLKTDESEGNSSVKQSQKAHNQKLIEKLIESAKNQGKQDIITYLDISNGDKQVNQSEFIKKIQFIDGSVKDDDAYQLFLHIQDSKTNKVSLKQLVSILRLNEEDDQNANNNENANLLQLHGIDIKKFIPYKQFFYEVNNQLNEEGLSGDKMFHKDDEEMNPKDFQYVLQDLKINMQRFDEDIKSVIKLLDLRSQVNTQQFCQILQHFKDTEQEEETIEAKRAVLLWFIKINAKMEEYEKMFSSLFQKKEERGGFINRKVFEEILQKDLHLIRDTNYNKYFTRHLILPKSTDEYFSLEKLKEGLEREKQTLSQLSRLRKVFQDQGMTPEKMFNKMDINEKKELDLSEFTNMIQIIDDKMSKQEIINLFERMDANSDGRLTSKEFCSGIWQGSEDATAIEEVYIKPFVETIQIKLKLDKSKKNNFTKHFGRKAAESGGKLKEIEFKRLLEEIKYDMEENDKQYTEVVNYLKKGGQYIDCNYFEELYDKFKDRVKDLETDEPQKDREKVKRKKKDSDDEEEEEKVKEKSKRKKGSEDEDDDDDKEKYKRKKDSEDEDNQKSKKKTNKQSKISSKLKESLEDIILTSKDFKKEIVKAEDHMTRLISTYAMKNILDDFEIRTSVQDVSAFAEMHESLDNKGNINHEKLFRSVKESQNQDQQSIQKSGSESKSGGGLPRVTREFEQFAVNLNKDLQRKKKNLLSIGRFLDKSGDGVCKASDLYDQLDLALDSKLTKDDIKLIEENIPINKKKINYVDFSTIMMEAQEKADKNANAENDKKTKSKGKKNKDDDEDDDDSNQKGKDKGKKSQAKKKSSFDDDEDEQDDQNDDDDDDDKKGKSKKKSKGKKSGKSDKVSKADVDNAMQALIKSIKDVIAQKKISLRTVFRQFDDDQDGLVTKKEFTKGIKHLVKELDYHNTQLMDLLFDQIDTDSDFQFNFFDLKQVIYPESKVMNMRKLLQRLKKQLACENDEDLTDEFKKMDTNGDQTLSFQEFNTALTTLFNKNISGRRASVVASQLTQPEIQELYEYFDKDKQGRIKYEHFKEVLTDEHLNLKLIGEKIKKKMETENTNLKSYFRKYSGNKEEMGQKQFNKFMEALSFEFDDDQLEELFSKIDSDFNGEINYDEIDQNFYSLKEINVDTILRKLRREIVNRRINLQEDFQLIDPDEQGIIYKQWTMGLKQRGLQLDPMESEALFNKFADNKNKVSWRKFLNDLFNINYDISEIRKRILQLQQRYNFTPIKLFDMFDTKRRQQLDMQDFDSMLQALDMKLGSDELREAFYTFDLNKNSVIQFPEFNDVIFNNRINMSLNPTVMMNYRMDYRNDHQTPPTLPFLLKNQGNMQQTQYVQFNDLGQLETEPTEYTTPYNKSNSQYDSYGQSQFQQQSKKNNSQIQLPNRFDEKLYFDAIKKACLDANQDPFDLFSQFDRRGTLTIDTTQDLQGVFDNLVLQPPIAHVKSLFQNCMNKQGEMNYLRVLRVIMPSFDLIKKVILFEMKQLNLSLQKMFEEVLTQSRGKTSSKSWSYNELQWINDHYEIDLHESQQLQPVWDQWVSIVAQSQGKRIQSSKAQLILSDIATIFEIPVNYVPSLHEGQLMQGDTRFFNPDRVVEDIRYKCEIQKVNILDLFTFIDREKKYFLDKVEDLEFILKLIGVQLNSSNDANLLFQHYSDPNDNKIMRFLGLIKKIMKPTEIMRSVCHNILRVNNMTVDTMFNELQNGKVKKYWDIKDFSYINQILELGFDKQELQDIFESWSLKQTLNIQLLSEILGIHPGVSPQFLKQEFEENQIKVINNLQMVNQQAFKSQGSFQYNPFDSQRDQHKVTFEDQMKQNLQSNSYQSKQPQRTNQKEEDYDPELQEEDRQRLQKFYFEMSKVVETKGFSHFKFKASSDLLTEQEVYNIIIGSYDQNDDDLLRWCVHEMCKPGKGKIYLDHLKELLQVQEQIISPDQKLQKEQQDKALRDQMGIINDEEEEQKPKDRFTVNQQIAAQLQQTLIDFFEKKYSELINVYFPMGGKPLLGPEDFVGITQSILSKTQMKQIRQDDILHLFYYIDANQGGTVSLMEMKEVFFDPKEQKTDKNKNNVIISEDLEKEIQALFNEVDIDKSKYIEISEIQIALSKIGMNCGQSEIEQYMRRFDKNGDGKISYPEFRTIVQERLKSEMMTAEDMIDDIRREFQKVDVKNTRLLNLAQLGQVMKSLGVQLSQEQLNALFNEIDVDKSKTIDIDEMIYFITKNTEGMSGLAQAAVLNIRSSKKLSLTDMREAFGKMPSNFRNSFIRALLKKNCCLLSSIYRPKLDASQCYIDLKYAPIQAIDPKQTVLDHSPKIINYIAELFFDQAQGVPIPENTSIPRQNLIYREMYIMLYDNQRSQFVGGVTRIQARWEPDYEDRWYFNPKNKQGESNIYIKLNDYDDKKDTSLNLCIELVLHYITPATKSGTKSFQDVEMSCCYGMIPLFELQTQGTKSIAMQGGEPNKLVSIKKEDIRTNRTGWRAIVKAVSSNITTCMKIEVLSKPVQKVLEDLSIFPNRVIICKNSVPFLKSFREYFGFRSICLKEIDITLPNDQIIKYLLRIIDQPDTFDKFIYFWRDEVQPRCKNLEEEYRALEKAAKHSYILFSHNDFKFYSKDPSSSCWCSPNQQKLRVQLINLFLEDLRGIIGLKQQTSQQSKLRIGDNSQPFTMQEMLDEDDDEDMQMLESYAIKKMGQSIR